MVINDKIGENAKSLVVGVLLGDAGKSRKTFYFGHSIKQLEFALHKKNLLDKCLNINCSVKLKTNVQYPSVRVYVPVNKTATEMVLLLYGDILTNKGGKIISKEILSYLDAQSIAIWYMDDGSMSYKRKNGKIHGFDLTLNTYISQCENQIIIDYFKEKWGINWQLSKGKGKFRLRMGKREGLKFFEIIKPYINDSMKYKIGEL